MSASMWIWDLFYDIGGILVEDDINDFPWDPMQGGPGHIMGSPHHGMLGWALQQGAYVAGLMDVAAEVAKEAGQKDELQEVLEEFERLAYPTPPLNPGPGERRRR